jgi:type IV secretory pathway VirB2 component (pilin)
MQWQTPSDPIGNAANWLLTLLGGPAATGLATLAVALFGYHLLRGNASMVRGARLALGGVLLFSSVALARTLMGVGANMGSGASVVEVAPPTPLPPAQAQTQPNAFDPYAGASVPQ